MVESSQSASHPSSTALALEILDHLRNHLSAEKSLDCALRAVFVHWANNIADPQQVPEALLLRTRESLESSTDASAIQTVFEALEQYSGHSAVFNALISHGADKLGRIRHSALTSETLNSFIASIALAGAPQPRSVLDPACGYAGSLTALDVDHSQSLTGIELDEATADIAEMRLLLEGYTNFMVQRGSSLRQDIESRWDLIVSQPPFMPSISRDEVSAKLSDAFESRASMDGTAVWLRFIADGLSDSGRAVVVLPPTMFRLRSAQVITDLLRQDLVDALVSIPAGLVPSTNMPALLVVLNRRKDVARTGKLLVCNAADLGQVGRAPSVSSERIITSWLSGEGLPDCETWQADVIDVESYASDRPRSPREILDVPPIQQQSRPEPLGRGLSSLHLQGFKGIDELTSIPLRPLTLIYGKNSAGKSSLIQSLLLLAQSVKNNAFTASGEFIDLGSFQGLQHGHIASSLMSIGVTWSSTPEIDSAKTLPDPSQHRTGYFTFTNFSTHTTGGPAVASAVIGNNHFSLSHDRATPGSLHLSAEDTVRLVDLAYSEGATHPPRKPSAHQGDRVKRKLRNLGIEKVPFQQAALSAGGLDPQFSVEFEYRAATGVTHNGIEISALKRAAEYLGAVGEELANLLERLVYIGPLRDVPQRFSRRQLGARNRDMPFYLLDNVAERRAVSEWLQQLGMPYELEIINPIVDEYQDTVGDVATMVLKDTRSGIEVTPADVGFGVSQVLPIVTELSARTNSIILIEQPEIHLHPAMQAELADLLIESTYSNGNANQVIAETHSETLILRVQKRIREMSLFPEDVLVLYVDQDDEGRSVIEELRIDDDGDFIDTWPGGFFAEQFDEMFG